jgi:hypothetical protein
LYKTISFFIFFPLIGAIEFRNWLVCKYEIAKIAVHSLSTGISERDFVVEQLGLVGSSWSWSARFRLGRLVVLALEAQREELPVITFPHPG